MRWLMTQLKQRSSRSLEHSEGFQLVHLPLDPINAEALVSRAGEASLEICATGRMTLLFHTHSWGGAIFLKVNGEERIESMYSEADGFKAVVVEANSNAPVKVQIRSGATADPHAKGAEIWLAAIDFDEVQGWEVVSQPITEHCTLTRGQFGSFLTLSSDNTIGASIVRDGVWAPRDVEFFRSQLRPGMTVLDVGANIGHHTVLYSSIVGAAGRVIGFEPQSVIFRLLAGNIAINGCENTDLIQSCVGEAEGTVHLFPIKYSESTNFGSLGVDIASDERGAAKGERCRIATLDRLLDELHRPIERCDFIKIDVQSFELYVLKGGRRTLEKYRPMLFLEVAPFWMSKSYDYREIYEYLWSLGYQIEHPSDPELPNGAIKEWSGREGEEWDIIARHTVSLPAT